MYPGLKSAIPALCALLAALPAGAHTHLVQSTPAHGSVVAASPPQLRLVFSAAANLTALTLQGSADPAPRKLTPLPRQRQLSFAIDLPRLAAGSYLVRWRTLSEDGHVASGSFGFTLRP